MSWANFGEPATLVRSPMLRKLTEAFPGSAAVPAASWSVWENAGETPALPGVLPRNVSASNPLNRIAGSTAGTVRGGKPLTASAIALIWGGVVPQQPPTMLSQPFCAHSRSCGASVSGVSGKPVGNKGFGRPAFG